MAEEEVLSADVEHLKSLETLLQDSTWHPAAIPIHAKRCLLTYNSRRARRLRRWHLARLLGTTNQHDRHSGGPIDIPPVYGDDTASEDEDPVGDSSQTDGRDDASVQLASSNTCDEAADTCILTWNINAAVRQQSDCTFVLPQLRAAHVTCLQEATPGAVGWIAK